MFYVSLQTETEREGKKVIFKFSALNLGVLSSSGAIFKAPFPALLNTLMTAECIPPM